MEEVPTMIESIWLRIDMAQDEEDLKSCANDIRSLSSYMDKTEKARLLIHLGRKAGMVA